MNKSTINVNLNRFVPEHKEANKATKRSGSRITKGCFFGFLFFSHCFSFVFFFSNNVFKLVERESPKGKTICDNV